MMNFLELSTKRLDKPTISEKSRPVPKELINYIGSKDIDNDHKNLIINCLKLRSEEGIKVYNQYLHTFDGRPPWSDSWQELLDAMQYIYKDKMEGNITPEEIKCALAILNDLVNL